MSLLIKVLSGVHCWLVTHKMQFNSPMKTSTSASYPADTQILYLCDVNHCQIVYLWNTLLTEATLIPLGNLKCLQKNVWFCIWKEIQPRCRWMCKFRDKICSIGGIFIWTSWKLSHRKYGKPTGITQLEKNRCAKLAPGFLFCTRNKMGRKL